MNICILFTSILKPVNTITVCITAIEKCNLVYIFSSNYSDIIYNLKKFHLLRIHTKTYSVKNDYPLYIFHSPHQFITHLQSLIQLIVSSN